MVDIRPMNDLKNDVIHLMRRFGLSQDMEISNFNLSLNENGYASIEIEFKPKPPQQQQAGSGDGAGGGVNYHPTHGRVT